MSINFDTNGFHAQIEIDVGENFLRRIGVVIAGLTEEPSPEIVILLRLLADDLDAIYRGGAPTAEQFAAAPRLDQWRFVMAPDGLRLAGVVGGHPRLAARTVLTSPVWCVDPGFTWARTLSRFYSMGAPSVAAPTKSRDRERSH